MKRLTHECCISLNDKRGCVLVLVLVVEEAYARFKQLPGASTQDSVVIPIVIPYYSK